MIYKKILFCSSIISAAISLPIASNFFINNLDVNSTALDSSTLNVSTRSVTEQYNHTNYFSMPASSSLPNNFEGYDLFAETNNSQFVQTNLGMLGISLDKKTFYFTSYSGKLIWAQQFSSNDIVKRFYESQNWTVSDANNVTIKEWALMDSTNKTLAVLLGDNTHQFITLINLDTGLFISSSGNYEIDVTKLFQALDAADYTNISKATSTSLFVWKNNSLTDLKYFTINNSVLASANITSSSVTSTFADKKILNFLSSGNHLFVLYMDSTSTSNSGANYNYKQYISRVSLSSNNFSLTGPNITLSSNYITNTNTLTTVSFKNIFFASTNQLIFLDGAIGNNHLQVFTVTTSGGLNPSYKTLSLEGHTIASVTRSSNGNRIYVASNQITNSGNTYLGYVDINQTSLSLSSIRQSTDSQTKNYFLAPVLSYTSSEYVVLQDNAKNPIKYMQNVSGNYTNLSDNMLFNRWFYKDANSTNLWNAFGQNYLANSLTWSAVSPYIDWTNITSTTPSFSLSESNVANGTTRFSLTFTYASRFNSSYNESFTVYFYIKNLYAISTNFVFNWLDAGSTIETSKVQKIEELKRTKYASQITAQDILDNFISYTIKKSDGSNLDITTNMISLSYSSSANLDRLTVTITIPTSGMPNGFANSSNRVLTKTYTGFMSLANYRVSTMASSNINTFTSNIYPSQLTQQNILDNFVNSGNGIGKTLSDWTITISNANDINGTVSVSVSYTNTSKIPNFEDLPQSVKNSYSSIINNVTYSNFKSIASNSGWSATPRVTDYSGSYLPSEIWGQYNAYLNGQVQLADVILLQNISFSLTDKNNLNIVCLNENSCDSDGYLDLQISIKNNSETVVDYNGNQYTTSNGKLVFNEQFLSNSGVTYPYQLKWNITTTNKFFYLVDRSSGSKLEANNNEYSINIKSNSPFPSSFANGYSSQISESDIANLVDTQGYTYSISLETNVDRGYTRATIQLALIDKPLFDYGNNNQNFTRTVYIYNFNVPVSSVAKHIMIASSGGIGALLVGGLIWFLLWKIKLLQYIKKSYKWNKKKKDDETLKQLYRKNRYFKEDLWKKKISSSNKK
ncbi:lipoprotein 17-related variable surface protein [Malacoplasma penetrans]|nr:lipoprotein 17-related variable surface protein [Malacoplasma penetrans]